MRQAANSERPGGERGKRCPSGAFAEGESDPNESCEASSGLKRQRWPLRRLSMRKPAGTDPQQKQPTNEAGVAGPEHGGGRGEKQFSAQRSPAAITGTILPGRTEAGRRRKAGRRSRPGAREEPPRRRREGGAGTRPGMADGWGGPATSCTLGEAGRRPTRRHLLPGLVPGTGRRAGSHRAGAARMGSLIIAQ